MTKQLRTFTPEFKREAASLVLDQGYSHIDAARSLRLVDTGRHHSWKDTPLPSASLC